MCQNFPSTYSWLKNPKAEEMLLQMFLYWVDIVKMSLYTCAQIFVLLLMARFAVLFLVTYK